MCSSDLTRSGASVLASCSFWDNHGAVVLLVPEKPEETSQVLKAAGFTCQAHSVVVLGPESSAGLAPLVVPELLAAGINVLYSYAARSDDHAGYVVLGTTDNDRAVRLLGVNSLVRSLARAKNASLQAA